MEITLAMISKELFLNSILRKHGVNIFLGDTSYEQRKKKAAHYIREFAIANELVLGKTVAQHYESAYFTPYQENPNGRTKGRDQADIQDKTSDRK